MLNRVYGHKEIKEKLVKVSGNLPLLTIFNGPKGIGKKFLLLNFIDEIYGGSFYKRILVHPDIRIYTPPKKIFKLEFVHEIQKHLMDSPFELDKKFFILEDGDCMNKQAANACLKMFEESPHFNHFFILARDVGRLPDTFLSRGVVFDFKPIKNLRGLFPDLTERQEVLLDGCPGRYSLLKELDLDSLQEKILLLFENYSLFSYSDVIKWFRDLGELDLEVLSNLFHIILLEGVRQGRYENLFPILSEHLREFKDKLKYSLNLDMHFRNMLVAVRSEL